MSPLWFDESYWPGPAETQDKFPQPGEFYVKDGEVLGIVMNVAYIPNKPPLVTLIVKSDPPMELRTINHEA